MIKILFLLFMNVFIKTAQAHGPFGRESSDISPLFYHHVPGESIIGTLMVVALLIAAITGVYLFLKQRKENKSVSTIQKIGWVYVVMFFITASLTYIPGLSDEQGNFMGLFKLDLIDDLLHFGSGLWILWASYHSTKQAIFYFQTFGSLYFLDFIVGMITQRGVLDFGLWLYEHPGLSLAANIGANAPHFLIGGIALIVGFGLGGKQKRKQENNA